MEPFDESLPGTGKQIRLKPVADKRNELLEPYLKKADYRDGGVKRQVGNILKSIFTAYRFQTFGEFSAMLSCFNIEAKQVRENLKAHLTTASYIP